MPGTLRDSLFILDAIHRLDAVEHPEVITTDQGSYSDLVSLADADSRQVESNAAALGILLRSYPDFDDPVLSEWFAQRSSQDRY
ncbi:hypothetical protein SAMN05216276_102895 [Streptosporangium subroseum]|uniref:Uncharacterized protein n=1 Tax=Streptosporangium subroseum TaxID=106412 RepID=A0A239KTP5_9ACTN|nr:hypothetical protein [Streptosporangium subroseum]SNT20879.1 hypothetical protein SAMN05216276_102895 [Streptosporangium subroseum]